MILARGFAALGHGTSARGALHLPGSPRCTPFGLDRANDLSQHLADGLPRPVGVEVVVCVCEASDLHAPSIRMETDNDVQYETPKSSSDVRHDC